MNDQMKAAVFHGPRDVTCEDISRPTPGPGEAILRVRACGICGSDLHTYRHGLFLDLGALIDEPDSAVGERGRVMGHEFSGEIVEIASDSTFAVGDRVVTVGIGANAEFVKVRATADSLLSRFADHVSFEEAATTEPLATSLHAVNLANPQDGETHVVMGAGIIGLGVLQCIKAKSSAKVIVVDLSARRLALAAELGADETVNARDQDAVESILSRAGRTELSLVDATDSTIDTVYDCAGLGKNYAGISVLAQALTMVRFGGKVVVVAVFEKPAEIDVNTLVRKGVQLLGSWTWSPEEFAEALKLINDGSIDRKPLVTHRFSLEEASTAYETQLQEEEAVKVMFTP